MKQFLNIAKLVFPVAFIAVFAFSNTSAMERFDIIATYELQKLLVERDSGHADFLLVNTLDRIIFQDEAIPGSLNLPVSRIRQNIGRLGDDKNRLIIFYCKGYR